MVLHHLRKRSHFKSIEFFLVLVSDSHLFKGFLLVYLVPTISLLMKRSFFHFTYSVKVESPPKIQVFLKGQIDFARKSTKLFSINPFVLLWCPKREECEKGI